MKFWWQEQSWVFTAQSLHNVKNVLTLVVALWVDWVVLISHSAHTKPSVRPTQRICWDGDASWGEQARMGREGCSIVHIAIDLPHFLTIFLAALAALCIPTLVTDCYDPFWIQSLPDLGEVIGMVGEIRASGEGDKHMRRKGNT